MTELIAILQTEKQLGEVRMNSTTIGCIEVVYSLRSVNNFEEQNRIKALSYH